MIHNETQRAVVRRIQESFHSNKVRLIEKHIMFEPHTCFVSDVQSCQGIQGVGWTGNQGLKMSCILISLDLHTLRSLVDLVAALRTFEIHSGPIW